MKGYSKMKITITAILSLLVASSSFGQENQTPEVPNDLIIRLDAESRGRPKAYSYAVTINHYGVWHYEGFRGFHVGRFTSSELGEAHKKRLGKLGKAPTKIPVKGLGQKDLAKILKEFDAVDFFNLGDNYSFGQIDPKTGKPILCFLHSPIEKIYLSYGGRSKVVQNFTGCPSTTSQKLAGIAKLIRSKLGIE
jgi:hypothetical protein